MKQHTAAIVLGAETGSAIRRSPGVRTSSPFLREVFEQIVRERCSRDLASRVVLGRNLMVTPLASAVAEPTSNATSSFGEMAEGFARVLTINPSRGGESPIEPLDAFSAAAMPNPITNVNPLLAETYHLDQSGRIDAAIDLIFDAVDSLLCAGDFEGCDFLLQRVEVQRLSVDLMIAFLSITLTARDRLRERARFYSRVKHQIESERSVEVTDFSPQRLKLGCFQHAA